MHIKILTNTVTLLISYYMCCAVSCISERFDGCVFVVESSDEEVGMEDFVHEPSESEVRL